MLNNISSNCRLVGHWWTEWAPAWGYIPATGAGEEDTLWRCPNIPRIIWRVSYPCHLIGQGMILHKWSFTFWPTVRGCPPLPSELTKYSPQAMSVFSSRIHQWGAVDTSKSVLQCPHMPWYPLLVQQVERYLTNRLQIPPIVIFRQGSFFWDTL